MDRKRDRDSVGRRRCRAALGCVGVVFGTVEDKVTVSVEVVPPEPPFGLAIARSVQESYISSYDAAKVLNMNPGIFGKITGSLHFDPGRYDLGLNLKYKHDLSVLGYTRRRISEKERNETEAGRRPTDQMQREGHRRPAHRDVQKVRGRA